MRFEDATDFRRALEGRLKELADEDEVWLARDRRSIAFGRMLARLNATAPGCWSLAGGFALDCRSLRPRAARELDIEWRVDRFEGYLEAEMDAVLHDAGDLFEFGTRVGGSGVSGRRGAHRRIVVNTYLAGELFETSDLKFRLRFGDVGTEKLQTENLLDFAGIEPVEVDAMAIEVQLADQLLDYTKAVAHEADSPSAENLLDLKLIAELPALDATNLALSISALFGSRNEAPPESLPAPSEESDEWYDSYERVAGAMGAPTDLDDGHSEAAALLDPILSGEIFTGTWSPTERCWMP
ncbi:MAG TPA: hypothetical protein VIY71_01740 [Solirubrobacterales bacterium]